MPSIIPRMPTKRSPNLQKPPHGSFMISCWKTWVYLEDRGAGVRRWDLVSGLRRINASFMVTSAQPSCNGEVPSLVMPTVSAAPETLTARLRPGSPFLAKIQEILEFQIVKSLSRLEDGSFYVSLTPSRTKTSWCFVGNEGMDPYSLQYSLDIPRNSPYDALPHSLLSTSVS